MAERTLKVEIIGDASSLQKALGKATDSSSKFGSTMAKAGKAAAVGLAALGVGAVVAGKKMIDMASDAAEVDSKLDVVFGKSLPDLTKNLDKFSEATGASRYALREQAADMGALLAPLVGTKKGAADMSEQFVKLATDLGSFNNVPVDDALLAIRSGLVGEAEPLRRFGVLLNEAAVKNEALRLGLVKGKEELTERDKVLARSSLIMAQTTLAQDDATRTAGSMANQMKALKNNVTDMATSLGTLLIPYALQVVQAFNDNWPTIEAVVKAVLTGIIAGIQGVVTAVQWLRGQWEIHRESAIKAWEAVRDAVMRVVRFFETDVLPAIRTVVNFAKAIWENFGGEITTILGRIVASVKAGMQNMIAPVKIILDILRGDWSAAWDELKGVVSRTLGNMIANIRALLGSAASVALTLAKAIGRKIIEGILDGLEGIANKIGERMQNIWDALKTAATTAWGLAKAIGRAIVNGIKSGIADLWDGVKGWFEGQINELLHPDIPGFSPVEDAARKAIGHAIALGSAKGISEKQKAMYDALVTALQNALGAVQDKKAAFADAFSNLASAALGAFDAAMSAWVPPSQKLLDKRQLDEQKRQLTESIKSTAADVKTAQQELAQALAGGDPEQIKAAQAAVRQATEAHNSALRAQQDFNLEQLAKKEQEAHDKRAARQRIALENELERIQAQTSKKLQQEDLTNAERERITRNGNQRVLNALEEHGKKLGVNSEFWGSAVGIGMANGLNKAISAVAAAARQLARAIQKLLKLKSPAEEGPMADIDVWWDELGPMLASSALKGLPAVKAAGTSLAKGLMGGADVEGSVVRNPFVQWAQDVGDTVEDVTVPVQDFTDTLNTTRDTAKALASETDTHFENIKKSLEKFVPPAIAMLQLFLDKLNNIREMYLAIAGAADKAGDVTGGALSLPPAPSGGGGGGGGGGGNFGMSALPVRGGTLVINNHFPNYVGDRRELIQAIQEANGQWMRANGGSMLG